MQGFQADADGASVGGGNAGEEGKAGFPAVSRSKDHAGFLLFQADAG